MEGKKDLSTAFETHKRETARKPATVLCALCQNPIPQILSRIADHLRSQHPDYLVGRNETEVTRRIRNGEALGEPAEAAELPMPEAHARAAAESSTGAEPPSKTHSPARRSRGPPPPDDEFKRSPQRPGKLWTPGSPAATRTRAAPSSSRASGSSASRRRAQPEDPTPLVKQMNTRAITKEQLEQEMNAILEGLEIVEAKCHQIDTAENLQGQPKLTDDQWKSLIALHRTLLYEHHDLYLAAQHPAGNEELRQKPGQTAMPRRMWRFGVAAFMALLQKQPSAREHMFTFFHIGWTMFALLYETVVSYQPIWAECLGDLSRVRMSLEADNPEEQQHWGTVAQGWYLRAIAVGPGYGQLYYRMASLSQRRSLQQMFYYAKSLCVDRPFGPSRGVIPILFNTDLPPQGNGRDQRMDALFINAHIFLVKSSDTDQFGPTVAEFLGGLDHHIGQKGRGWTWKESGSSIAIINCCALLAFRDKRSAILKTMRPEEEAKPEEAKPEEESLPEMFEEVLYLVRGTCDVVLRRFHDPQILPFLHVMLVFLDRLSGLPEAMALLENAIPWHLISGVLNSLLASVGVNADYNMERFPATSRPLPEDFKMRNLIWVTPFFPPEFFQSPSNVEEQFVELPSMTEDRKKRILWLGSRIAKKGEWLIFDQQEGRFGTTPRFDGEEDTKMELE